MRRIGNHTATPRTVVLEMTLVAALLGAALILYGMGDQLISAISDLIANFHAA